MRFDHLLHWVPDLEAAMAQYRALGFHAVRGGQHPGRGTHNALCHLGLPYIELLAVHDWELARSSSLAPMLGRIQGALAAGGGALMFAVSVDDLSAACERVRAAGYAVGDILPGSRQRPDGSLVTWRFARFADGPPWRPFFIQWGLGPADREADLRARGTIAAPQDQWRLARLVVETADPQAGAAWLAGALGLPAQATGDGEYTIPLPGCAVALTRGTAERITRVVFAGPGGAQGTVAGLRFER